MTGYIGRRIFEGVITPFYPEDKLVRRATRPGDRRTESARIATAYLRQRIRDARLPWVPITILVTILLRANMPI